jgi:hypothetical protein
VRNMDFHYTLLENGLAFVLSSLEHLTSASGADTKESKSAAHIANRRQKRHLKYALLHLCSGIELIFKERLRQEDWRLLFTNPEVAEEEDCESGDFQSVNFHGAQNRLEKECGVEFTLEQKTDLRSFRNRRNKVEHFGVVDTLLAVQSSIIQMVNFLIDFVQRAFESDQIEEEEDLLSEIRAKVGSCRAVVEERWAIIRSGVDNEHSVVQCPACRQEVMSADGGRVKCLFCHYSPYPETAADEFVENILGYTNRYAVEKDGGVWPVRNCPECGSETLVTKVPGAFDVNGFYCFNCGIEYAAGELETCHDCGELYNHDGEPGSHICSDCFRAKVAKDD